VSEQSSARATARALPTIACAVLALAPATAGADDLAAVDAFVRAEMARQKVPGVAIAIVRGGEVVTTRGYGLANVEHQVPVKAETIFQSGSVGKQFTAAAVMLMVEEGRLSLSDPITRFFPDAPTAWAGITVRHLLTHTSGIPDYTTDTLDYRKDYTEDELARLAFGLALEFPPGSRWNYSNTGYVLLGVIVGKVSGRFYGDVLQERVFTPLGMKTACVISEEDIVPNRAAGYRLVDGALKNQEWVAPKLNTTADGSLYLSALDMVAWDRGLRAGAVLRPESWARVYEPVRLTSGKTYPYGFGWGVEQAGGQAVRRHGGSWQGFKSEIARFLGSDLTIIVFANLAEADPERFTEGIAAVLDARLATPELAAIPDREPAVTARLRDLLAAAAGGTLAADQFAYVRAGFFPEGAQRLQTMLRDLGAPTGVSLLQRRELGDDVVYQYDVAYGARTFRVSLGVAPDGKLSGLSVRPK
jgi:CubicO group peptidase (beta-lactamase class C family)